MKGNLAWLVKCLVDNSLEIKIGEMGPPDETYMGDYEVTRIVYFEVNDE